MEQYQSSLEIDKQSWLAEDLGELALFEWQSELPLNVDDAAEAHVTDDEIQMVIQGEFDIEDKEETVQ